MTQKCETWLPGSVEKKHGHVLISPSYDLYANYTSNFYRFMVHRPFLVLQSDPSPYRFCVLKGSLYYVNGRREVYETNISNPSGVVFGPVGREWNIKTSTWDCVLFRKLHKLEWLFT